MLVVDGADWKICDVDNMFAVVSSDTSYNVEDG